MDQGSKLILEKILAKTPGEITETDKEFLRARRSYVSHADLERLGAIPEEPVNTKEKPLSQMNKTELIAKAAEMGVQVPDGAKNKEIVELLSKK
jgi:hypothetical protein